MTLIQIGMLPALYPTVWGISGIVADRFGVISAMWLVARITFLSSVLVAVRMRESMEK